MDNLSGRTIIDRRITNDRRQFYDVLVMDVVGQERRKRGSDRRKKKEQRKGWTRINKWISVPVPTHSA